MLPSHLLLKSLFLLFSIFYSVFSDILTFCYQGKSCYELNDITFHQKWNRQLNHKLQNVSQIRVHDLYLNEENYVTLFSHTLPNLQKIIFWSHQFKSPSKQYLHKNPLTPKIVQSIFTSPYFSQLKELDLSYTNLDFRHFTFLENIDRVISSNLKILILTGNYLEKRSFNLLERINFNGKLNSLALSENSLITPESVKSVVKMIKSTDGSKSNLKNLTVYNTQISRDSMIQLLQSIEVQKMVNLNLARNPFQHSKKFTTPFNNSFYSFLSKSNFSSLRRLCLTQLDLDQEQLPYFINFKLQSLETLQLTSNFITDQYFGTWISKQNLPKLTSLRIDSNSISDHAIKFIAEQNFPNLTELYLAHNRKLTPKHLEYLAIINSSKWTYLDLSHNSVLQTTLRTFFHNKSFDNLVHLKLQSATDSAKLFDFLPWQSMNKLKYFQTIQTDLSQSLVNIYNHKISFPSLKIWTFGGNWITKKDLSTLVRNLKQFGSRLELVEVLGSNINNDTLYVNLSELEFDSVPKGMYLYNVGFMTVRRPESEERFQILQLVLNGESASFFQTMLHYSFLGKQKENSNYINSAFRNPSQLNMALEYLSRKISFDKIEMFGLRELTDFLFFKKLFFKQDPSIYAQEYKQFVQFKTQYKASVYMPYLKRITYLTSFNQLQAIPFLFYLTKMRMPNLNEILILGQRHKEWIQLANKLLLQQNLIRLIILVQDKLNCDKFHRLFQSVRFPFLKTVSLANNQIEPLCLKTFINNHNLIRSLDFSKNFLQAGVFDSILAKNSLILNNLEFSLIQIGNQQFSQIATLNRQFILTLFAQSVAIDSIGILWLVGNSTSTYLFPRSIEIHLGNNNINQTGVEAFLQTGMPFLKYISFSHTDNPNLLNNLLSYPNQFSVIIIQSDFFYGLSNQLDGRSTRHVANIQIESSSLTFQDYKVLSEMNFNNLQKAILTFQNIYECQILKYILKIVQNTNSFRLIVKNDKIKGNTMSDQCIDRYNSTQIYMRNLDKFNIFWFGQYFYIPKFYTYFYSQNQLVTILVLANCLIGDQEFIRILERCNILNLLAVILLNNLLTTKSISKFFSKEWPKLKYLDLGHNFIGSQALSNIAGKSFNQLIDFGLQLNQIDIKGIQYLTQASFITLTNLLLDGNDITKEAFIEIFQINAPKLTYLSVNNILMSENDLVWALERISIQKFPFLSIIETNIKVGWKNSQRLRKLLNEKFKRPGFTLTFQKFYLKNVNKAIA